jgi:Acyl-CoA dehydrogenase, N-terminal domain
MGFSFELTPAQHDLVARTHKFAGEVVRPVAEKYDREEEFPWPVLERAAEEGLYNALFYRDLIADPTGLGIASAVHGGAVLGMRRHWTQHRDARPGAVGDGAGGHTRAADAMGAGVLRRAGRPQARRPLRIRAAGRQRRGEPAHSRGA